jgi:hypothetical protein
MKMIFTSIVMSLLFSSAFAGENPHQHHGKTVIPEEKSQSTSPLVLNHGKKWPIDQTMRENMGVIHQQFKIISSLSKSKKATNKDTRAFSDMISTSAQNIISKCKMEKLQDEAFHVILADLLAVADDLKKPERVEPALTKLDRTFKTYTQYFDHSL